MTKSLLFFSAFAIFIFSNCSQSNNKTDTSSSSELKIGGSENEGIFQDPNKLCKLLSQNGIGDLKEWGNPMDMGWGSLTDYYQFGPEKDGLGMRNNIAYYLEGTETIVSKITINLNINNSSDKNNALKFLADVTQKTFSSLNLTLESDLKTAILSSKTYKGEVRDFMVSIEMEKSKIETWKVVIMKK